MGCFAGAYRTAVSAEKDVRILMSLPYADSVCAIGDFNNWSTVATPLSKVDDDQWELRSLQPEVEVERLSFFVIARGARYGRVIDCRDLIHTR
jgi:hypothetical protein